MAQPDLFGDIGLPAGVVHLPGFALERAGAVLAVVDAVTQEAVFRKMQVPGGGTMSVAMSNCGRAGWVSDASGYRYSETDPLTGRPWPAMPDVIVALAQEAAQAAGFAGFDPDACLINRYEPGARMGLHQDRDERDRKAPIVSVSFGLQATFLFGGAKRSDSQVKLTLEHGDVVVWGGPARLYYHGIAPLRDGVHPVLGRQRLNLTLRKAF